MDRSKDLIDWLEEKASESGDFAGIDERYVKKFLTMPLSMLEQTAAMVVLDQAKTVCQLAKGESDEAAVQRATEFVANFIRIIAFGIAQFNEFGHLRFFARIGIEPETEFGDEIEERIALLRPAVANAVRKLLPTIQSTDFSQGSLPL